MKINEIILENILESLPVGLIVIGSEGEIIRMNKILENILGVSHLSLSEKGWSQFFIENENNTDFNQIIIDVIQHEILQLKRHVPYITPDNQTKYLDVISSYLKDDGRLTAIVVLFDDVTEVHELYAREKDILQEINEIHKQRLDGLNKLAVSIAHQIRNPASAIGGFAGLLLKKYRIGNDAHPFLQAIKEESTKLEHLVNKVREYASLKIKNIHWHRLDQLIKDSSSKINSSYLKSNKQIIWKCSYTQDKILCDSNLLCQAFTEIIQNSIAFTQSEIVNMSITCLSDDERVTIIFQDCGGGVQDKNLPFLFDPFYTTRPDSSGMGLALVKRIILEHHGEIFGSNRKENGFQVTIQLPIKSPALENSFSQ